MGRFTNTFNLEGRLYSADDINAGAMVALDRRLEILEHMIRRFPDIPVMKMHAVMQEQELLLTCSEPTFLELTKQSQEAAK